MGESCETDTKEVKDACPLVEPREGNNAPANLMVFCDFMALVCEPGALDDAGKSPTFMNMKPEDREVFDQCTYDTGAHPPRRSHKHEHWTRFFVLRRQLFC